MKRFSRRLATGLLVAAVLLTAGVAWVAAQAQIAATTTPTFYACINPDTGVWRPATASTTCLAKKGEMLRSWVDTDGFTALEARVDAVETNSTVVAGRVATVEATVTAVTTRLATVEGSVTTLQGTVDSLDGQVSALDTRLGAVETPVASWQTQIPALDARVGAVEATVTAVSSLVTALETKVNALVALQSKTVFLSSDTHTGTLGGLAGADAICQALADAAAVYNPRLLGTYKAWLSDHTFSPATRFTHSVFPYVDMNGAIIADDWADLTDGSLDAPIQLTETGAAPGGNVWTNTSATGARFGHNNCLEWTFDGDAGSGGTVGQTDSTWTSGEDMVDCRANWRIYCFQQ